ncbi:MAG: ATP phosphoribosyltransferase [Ruminococcaceae bacterium]|nr:ATP phosphoribosyltransferase [Oscillospiraceae bacterium]
MFDESILKSEERVIFALRSLYTKQGYRQFKMNKFEEYDLYSKNKDFLVSDSVITFTDTNGKLMALKPDVTLSIINNMAEGGGVQRYYYNENVYRVSDNSRSYKEIMQTGLECIGDITDADVFTVVELALKSLAVVGDEFVLNLSHVGLVQALMEEYEVAESLRDKVLQALTEKNEGLLASCCNDRQLEVMGCLVKSYATTAEAVAAIRNYAWREGSSKAVGELEAICKYVESIGYSENVRLDFSLVNATGYYSSIMFKGFVSGITSRVLSGGRYDMLMRKMGKDAGAIGFAVYLDAIEQPLCKPEFASDRQFINIALPKGRLGEKVYDMFERAGFPCESIREPNRKLIFENAELGLRFFWVKPSDVAIYVERGAADIGVAGKDILLEYEPDVFELLDLNMGKCRMAVAAKADFVDDPSATLRVATKFSNIARKYYASRSRDIDIINLNGSIEIAPILGLSDVIVDIVETGKTLVENDLQAFETIVPISARLIANKASFNFKTQQIEAIRAGLQREVKAND